MRGHIKPHFLRGGATDARLPGLVYLLESKPTLPARGSDAARLVDRGQPFEIQTHASWHLCTPHSW